MQTALSRLFTYNSFNSLIFAANLSIMGIAGFLKTLFFILIIYYGFKFLSRLLLPVLVKFGLKKMQQRQQQTTDHFRTKAKEEEGKVTIHVNKGKSKNIDSQNDGEYIDYEEIK